MFKLYTKILTLISFLFCNSFLFSQDSKDFYFRALAELEYKNFSLALSNINSAVFSEPENNDFLKLRGQIYLENNDISNAKNDFLRCVQLNDKTCLLELAKLYSVQNQADSAVFYLGEYLKFPYKISKIEIVSDESFENIRNTTQWTKLWDNYKYPKQELMLQDAQYYFLQNDLMNALIKTNEIIKIYKKFDKVYALKADILAKGNNFEEAVLNYTKAIELNPRNSDYYTKRAFCFSELKKYSKAIDDFSKSLELNELQLSVVYFLALNFDKDKQYEAAIQNIELYTKYYYKNNEAIYQKAKIYYNSGDYLSSIKVLNQLLAIDKYNPDFYYLRGLAYLNANSYKLSYSDFSMCLDINPKNTDCYYYRAMSSYKNNELDNACADWKTAIENKDYKANSYYYENCREFEKKNK